MYNSDMRLAHTPYHSLTINERNTLNARRNLLDHIGKRFREKALEKIHIIKTGLTYQSKWDILKKNNICNIFNLYLKASTFKAWGPAVRRKYNEDGLSDSESKYLQKYK